jgi:hypothetical protein
MVGRHPDVGPHGVSHQRLRRRRRLAREQRLIDGRIRSTIARRFSD